MLAANQQAGQAALLCLRWQSASVQHAVLCVTKAARSVIIPAHDTDDFIGDHDSVVLTCAAYLDPVSSQG